MGPTVPKPVPIAMGSLCYCLNEFSKGPGARARVANLRTAIAAIGPSYNGLAEVFDQKLVLFEFTSMAARKKIRDQLNANWFDFASPAAYFPGLHVSPIYAQGVLQALDLSLAGSGPVVPLNAWWVLDSTEFRLLSFTDVEGDETVGRYVTLLIDTPRPEVKGKAGGPWILGDRAEAYVTKQRGAGAVTQRVRDLP